MKTTIIFLVSILTASLCLAAETTNPIQDYATFNELIQGRIVYKWQIDLNNDGLTDVLLDTKLTPEEIAQADADTKNQYDPDLHGFSVYIAKADGSGYVTRTGIDEGDSDISYVLPQIDITRCFVGQITQLNKWGLVTIQTDYPRSGPGVSRIYAYTIEGDHLKQTLLAEYDPEQSNAIYDQYLSDSHRTQVQLQEVTL